jgi:hypothetical protein
MNFIGNKLFLPHKCGTALDKSKDLAVSSSGKLRHKMIPLELPCKTRFPSSKTCAMEFLTLFETFDDQRISL